MTTSPRCIPLHLHKEDQVAQIATMNNVNAIWSKINRPLNSDVRHTVFFFKPHWRVTRALAAVIGRSVQVLYRVEWTSALFKHAEEGFCIQANGDDLHIVHIIPMQLKFYDPQPEKKWAFGFIDGLRS